MTDGTRCTVLFPGLQRRQSLASSLLLCQATEKALEGCLFISHQAAPCLPHLWSSCWRAHLPFGSELSRCLGVSSSNLDLVPQPRDSEASQSCSVSFAP